MARPSHANAWRALARATLVAMKHFCRLIASLAVLALSSVSGCSGEQACTDIGCVDGVSIKLTNLASKYSAQLPLTVKVCTGPGGASCVTATVKPQTGQSPICEEPTSTVPCFVGPDGSLEMNQPVTASDIASGKIDVHVTVTDAMSMMLFDQTMTGMLKSSTPNGASCPPLCHQATVVFAV